MLKEAIAASKTCAEKIYFCYRALALWSYIQKNASNNKLIKAKKLKKLFAASRDRT